MADLSRGVRTTGSQRDKLAKDLAKKYEEGASIRALAQQTGRTASSTVCSARPECGFVLEGESPAPKRNK